jgi:hypothetical protein
MEAVGGGQPSQMIRSGHRERWNLHEREQGFQNFSPYTIGPGHVCARFSDITANTIVDRVLFSFGTGPDTFIAVPAPLIDHGLLALLAIAGALVGSNFWKNTRNVISMQRDPHSTKHALP